MAECGSSSGCSHRLDASLDGSLELDVGHLQDLLMDVQDIYQGGARPGTAIRRIL